VYYENPTDTFHAADDSHAELVQLVNDLKESEVNSEGGGFSINEHFQVIARMTAPTPYARQSIHVVGLLGGTVAAYLQPITFDGGALSPLSTPTAGEQWPGPLCGTSYSFAAPNSRKAPSYNLDEVFVEIEGNKVLLSSESGVAPYPPISGPLFIFLASLRHQLPEGGRFRVNEHGRAFTSRDNVFIGIVPLSQWFKALTPLS